MQFNYFIVVNLGEECTVLPVENNLFYVCLAVKIYSLYEREFFSLKITLNISVYFILYTCSWLRNYVTSQKVTGSIPDQLIGLFSIYLTLSATMVLSCTQPSTEMSTRNLPGE
jgi:hypothetical protein